MIRFYIFIYIHTHIHSRIYIYTYLSEYISKYMHSRIKPVIYLHVIVSFLLTKSGLQLINYEREEGNMFTFIVTFAEW